MAQFRQIFIVLSIISPLVSSFTVITSDSTAPSALIDGPQTGFTMTNDGARTDPDEQDAIYDIMRATGNDWAAAIPDVCRGRWHGIECMPDQDNVYHVVSLSFGALSDDTAFPTCDPERSYVSESLTRLKHLKALFFYRCLGRSPQRIPAFLGRLGSSLQTLVLRENGFLGPIPHELCNLTNLKVLDLHNNHLNGSIPLSFNRFSALTSLDMSANRFTGSIPGFLLPHLNVLDLNQNLLTGPVPSTLGACGSLIKIDISRNRVSGPIPDSINRLNQLVLLDLSYNRLSGPFPPSLQGLNSLQALMLKGNTNFSATIPENAFKGLKNLMILLLSNMNLQGSIPKSLTRLNSLRVLHMEGNNLTGEIPLEFRDAKHLSELRLNDNSLTGPVPFERDTVWRMRRKLRLYNNAGLCAHWDTDLDDAFGSTSGSSVRLCDEETPRPAPSGTVQHLSREDGDMSDVATDVSSSSKSLGFSFLSSFFLVFNFIFMLISNQNLQICQEYSREGEEALQQEQQSDEGMASDQHPESHAMPQEEEAHHDSQSHSMPQEEATFTISQEGHHVDVLLQEGHHLEASSQEFPLITIGDGFSDFELYISEVGSHQQMKSELDQYLEESLIPRSQDFEVLGWWSLNRTKYPTLSKMAADVLSLPFCTVSPDSVFDTEVKKMDNYRSSLRHVTLEALFCAKDWFKHGSSSSTTENNLKRQS